MSEHQEAPKGAHRIHFQGATVVKGFKVNSQVVP